MSRFTVVWVREALDELTEIWLQSADRTGVTRAVSTIDSLLGDDAHEKGHKLSEGLCRLDVPPLRVIFVVRDADRLVEVLWVRIV